MGDLISRKSLLECAEYDDKGRLVIPYRKVQTAPTEFDMEKVIEKLNQEKLRKDSIVLGSQVMITVREAVELVKNGWRD